MITGPCLQRPGVPAPQHPCCLLGAPTGSLELTTALSPQGDDSPAVSAYFSRERLGCLENHCSIPLLLRILVPILSETILRHIGLTHPPTAPALTAPSTCLASQWRDTACVKPASKNPSNPALDTGVWSWLGKKKVQQPQIFHFKPEHESEFSLHSQPRSTPEGRAARRRCPRLELRPHVGTGLRRFCSCTHLRPGPGSQTERKSSLSLCILEESYFKNFRLNFHQTESEYIFTPELNQAEIEPGGTC